MKFILLILWILMAAVEGAHAAPSLEYSTMIVDSTYYSLGLSLLDDNGVVRYAVDADAEGNLYIAAPHTTGQGESCVRVYRVDSTGAQVHTVLDMYEYNYCGQIDWTNSGLYMKVRNDDDRTGQIVKFTPEGTMVFSTDYPRKMLEEVGCHCIDNEGNLYVALWVGPLDSLSCIPVTPDAFDTDFNGGSDLVIQKYSPDGDLLYSSYLGGSGDDNVSEIAVDNSGGLYIYCWDISDDFPVPYENYDGTGPQRCIITISPAFDEFHAYYTSANFHGRMEVINDALYGGDYDDVFKYTLTGEPVVWIRASGESPEMMDISHRYKPVSVYDHTLPPLFDETGGIFTVRNSAGASSTTEDALFPLRLGGAYDILIWRITEDAELLYGTYFGGVSVEEVSVNAVEYRNGRLYIAGYTDSPDFPLTPGAYIDERTPPASGHNYPWSNYYWGLFAFCIDFNESTDFAEDTTTAPAPLALDPPHPNPFNPQTTLSFTLPEAGFARLAVYNLSGQMVRELAAEIFPAGRHEIVWDSRDADGAPVSSGVYIARLAADGRSAVRKVTLVR